MNKPWLWDVEATYTNWEEPVNFTSAKIFLLVVDDLSELYWEALDDDQTAGFSFICLENLSVSTDSLG